MLGHVPMPTRGAPVELQEDADTELLVVQRVLLVNGNVFPSGSSFVLSFRLLLWVCDMNEKIV